MSDVPQDCFAEDDSDLTDAERETQRWAAPVRMWGNQDPAVAKLSMAYSEAVGAASAVREGSWLATPSLGKRVAVQIPEAQWEKLAAAVCAIAGGEVV